MADGVVLLDCEGTVVLHNQACATLFGVPAGDLAGECMRGPDWRFTDADRVTLPPDRHPLQADGVPGRPKTHHGVGVSRGEGTLRWVRLSVRATGQLPGLGDCLAVVFERVPDPKGARSVHSLGVRPGEEDQLVTRLFGQRAVGMVHTSLSGEILRLNDVLAELLDRPAVELVGQRFQELALPEDHDRDRANLRRLVTGGADHHEAEVRLRRADGSTVTTQIATTVIRDADGQPESLLTMVVDVSRLRRVEHYMSRQAAFDPLTQLINRTLLIDLLNDRLQLRQHRLAVMALNLDRFRAVNDSLGQSTGDGVLVEVASRLREILRPGDAAARISGDDFLLLCSDVSSRADAEALTQRILDAVARPINVGGLRIQLTASAGVSLITPAEGITADEVMFQATAALAHAKQRGRARWKLFDGEMRIASTDRLRIETSLRAALSGGRLRVAYQPLMDLRTDVTIGAEALARWTDPVLGSVEPVAFLPVAEETGQIVALGTFVLADAVDQVAHWRDQTGAPLHVSVNLSPNELNRPGIIERVTEALDTANLPSTALRLEITETVLVDADMQVRRNLADLQALGVGVGIDDFGTGYASMSYLKTLPIDFVKIDKSFVDGIATSHEDRAIVKATIDLAKALQLTTVAEGIETPDQLDVLREMDCDVGQGYLIGHPAPAPDMLERFPSS